MVCRYGAAPLYWFNRLISPLITLGDWVAKWTLRLFCVEMTGAWLETEENAIESGPTSATVWGASSGAVISPRSAAKRC